MSRYPEDDLMKNLSPNEKRKLLRHIENSQEANKKSLGSKNYNITPKPFNNVGAKAQPSRSFTQYGGSGQSSVAKPPVTKSVQAPKSGSVQVMMPELNKDLVKKFYAQEAAVTKPAMKDSSNAVARSKPIKNNNPYNNSQPSGSSYAASNYAKVTPVSAPKPAAAPVSRPNSSNQLSKPVSAANKANVPPWRQQNANKNSFDNLKTSERQHSLDEQKSEYRKPAGVNSIANRLSQSQLKSAEQKKPSEVKQPLASVSKPAPSKVSRPVSASVPKYSSNPVKPNPTAQQQEGDFDQTMIIKSSPAFSESIKKPAVLSPQRGEPLRSEKNKGPPPTAVVTPIQDKSKVVSQEAKNSAEAARLRSISTPSQPKLAPTSVSYSSAADNVNLPDLSLAGQNSVMANEGKMKRSLSDASKVAAHLREPANKNKKLGHDFQPHELKDWLNWCDACGGVILSLFGKCVSCTKCKMVCHGKCALGVSLTCEADQVAKSHTLTDSALTFYKTIVQETKDESTLKEYNTIQRVITIEEVQERIEEFNRTVKGSQQMTLQENGETFRGFIRVTMNLTRPVSVVDNTSKTARKPSQHQRKASFYIDKGAVKALHLTSETTAEQVVQALLNKYSIADNPMKFALFEKQNREEGHVILRKMLPRERPLFLRLLWGNGSSDKRGFTLQENESRDIHWESFSIAELHMFIKILDKEENDYILDIKRKYKNKAKDIKNALEHHAKMAS